MMATDQNPRSIRFRIKRQDRPDETAYWQEFDVPYKPNMNIISYLQWIAANPRTVDGKNVASVVWDCSCLEEVCGACTMLVDGQVCQSCSTLVDEVTAKSGQNIVLLEPMSKFPVVRDLFVDRTRMFKELINIKGWAPIDGLHDLGPGPTESPEQQELRYALSRCMTCGCCLEACPQFQLDNDFVGAQAIGQTLYFNLHETGARLKDERLEEMEQPNGVADCGNAQNCVQVCPKDVPLTEAIAAIGRQTTLHAVRTFFTGR